MTVRKVSLGDRPAIHRFYDTSAISPSGKYVAYTEFQDDERLPDPGSIAYVVVVHLEEASEVYRTETRAWDTQVGAHAQWGRNDNELFFNRMATQDWAPYGVCVDFLLGGERALAGPVYMVSAVAAASVSPNLTRIWEVQPGYGVLTPESARPPRASIPSDDGVFVVDIESGAMTLIKSLRDIVDAFPEEFAAVKGNARGQLYGFHTKWSPDGRRIMFLVRWKSVNGKGNRSLNWIITMTPSGEDMKIALTPEQWAGGHHPNWCPDSETILMNLVQSWGPARLRRVIALFDRIGRRLNIGSGAGIHKLRFATFKYDGSAFQYVALPHVGSGHPTWSEDLNAILTDAYPHEPVTAGDGTVPIRLISMDGNRSIELLRMRTVPRFSGPRMEWRVDPHPAWSPTGDVIVFNGSPDGRRGVYIAELDVRALS
ncbi:hypothetical protein [Microbacterium aurantiacum]|uniref:hypothetical protein n=1 Tax=Microbacterium aurantiacum TaxID=162393 RepID=UPI003D74742D